MPKDFSDNNYIRESVRVAFEERPVELRDLNEEEQSHQYDIDFQQVYLDPYLMRRYTVDIGGWQECRTSSIRSAEISGYMDTETNKSVKAFKIADGWGGSVPSGKYMLTGFDIQDLGNKFSKVMVAYRQYGKWEKRKVADE